MANKFILSEYIYQDTFESKIHRSVIVLIITLAIHFIIVYTPINKIFENNLISWILFVFLTLLLLITTKSKVYKIWNSIFITCYFFNFLVYFIYFQSFNLINIIEPSIFYSYASNGKCNYDVIFTPDNLTKNNLEDTIHQVYIDINKDISTVSSSNDIFNTLSENSEVTSKLLDKNENFQTYLNSIEWTTDDVIDYTNKLSVIHKNIVNASFYISILLMLLISLLKSNFRNDFYVICIIMYFLLTLNFITNNFILHIILRNQFYTISELENLNLTLTTIKEAFLTAIIFDTLFQLNSVKIDKYLKK